MLEDFSLVQDACNGINMLFVPLSVAVQGAWLGWVPVFGSLKFNEMNSGLFRSLAIDSSAYNRCTEISQGKYE